MILLTTILVLSMLLVIFVGLGGAAIIIAFGDVIVFGLVMVLLVRFIKNKKKK